MGHNHLTQGFTLLEMAIVLVIVGLIVGGITFGRSMLITSRLQTVITDADNYMSVAAKFQQQYLALPGDLPTATSLWGTDSSGCPGGGGSTGTCNGNGDGMIGGVASYEYEVFRFWQQLYFAGMSSQKLRGTASSGGVYAATIGTNVPKGDLNGSSFTPVWEGTIGGGNANFFSGFYGNALIFGGTANTFATSSPILRADQAAEIDAKIDDGVAGTGKVRSFVSGSTYAPSCASGSAYNLAASGNLCSLIFITGF